MLHNIKYRNVLPPGFDSWTQLFLHCDLTGIVGHLTRHNARETLLFDPKALNPSHPGTGGKLELDVDFLKARLFDEFMLSTHVNTDAFRKMRAIAFTHPDQSAFEQQHFKSAFRELALLSRIVSRIKGDDVLTFP